MSKRIVLLSAVVVSFGLQIMPAVAEDQELQEVVVTARKRQESILKVPIIETAITQQSLNEFAVHDVKTLSQMVPALQIGTNLGDFGNQVSIRGIGNTTLNATVDQAVSLNIDGVQFTQGLAYQAGMFDVGQVEVLEGPQALFYGKSTTGGVISLRSNDPTDEVEVILRGGYEFEAAERKGEVILSGPVTDTLRLRLATSYSDMNGFFKNLAVGIPSSGGLNPRYGDMAPQEEVIIRGTAIWTPTDDFDVRLKANYNSLRVDGDDGAQQMTSCPNGVGPLAGLPTFIDPNTTCTVGTVNRIVDMNPADFPGIRNNGTPFNHLWQLFGSLEANYRPSDYWSVTSVTGYYKLFDADLFNGTDAQASGPLFAFDNNFSRRDVSEELRVNSTFDGPLNFTAGGYYQNGTAIEDLRGVYNQVFVPLNFYQHGKLQVDTEAYSFFGQARYQVLPDVILAAGARWSRESKHLSEFNLAAPFTATNPGLTYPIGPVATGTPNIVSYHINPEFTVTYTPADNLTLFGSYKQASKSGGFQTTIMQPAGTDLSFADESAKGGEVGVKSRLFGRRLSLNLSAYKYQYDNLQVGENLVTNQGLIVKTINAGTADIWGLELSGSYLPEIVPGLIVNGGVNYNHARFGSFLNAPCWGGETIAQGCNLNANPLLIDPVTGRPEFTAQNLSGHPLIRAPDWTLNFGFDYELPVGAEMKLLIASNTSYSGSYYTDLAERSDMVQGAYFKTNLSFTLTGPDDAWEVALIGNNLNNELTTGYCANSEFRTGDFPAGQITGGTTSGFAGPDELGCNIDRGREVWLRVTLRPLALLQ